VWTRHTRRVDTRRDGSDPGSALGTLDDSDDTTIDTGLTYRVGEPVLIRVRRRGHRYDIGDEGEAVELAGKPDGWLSETQRLVAEEGFNVNRSGVVFVPAIEGRDIASLALRLAGTCRTVYLSLLELAGV
jgi:hypothetical protein